SGIAAISVSGAVASSLFSAGKPLAAAQKALDNGTPQVAGFELPGVTITLKAAVTRERRNGRNVVAYLPATAPVTGVDKPWIAIGAHYDPLGRGAHTGSMAYTAHRGR